MLGGVCCIFLRASSFSCPVLKTVYFKIYQNARLFSYWDKKAVIWYKNNKIAVFIDVLWNVIIQI